MAFDVAFRLAGPTQQTHSRWRKVRSQVPQFTPRVRAISGKLARPLEPVPSALRQRPGSFDGAGGIAVTDVSRPARDSHVPAAASLIGRPHVNPAGLGNHTAVSLGAEVLSVWSVRHGRQWQDEG